MNYRNFLSPMDTNLLQIVEEVGSGISSSKNKMDKY